MKYYFLLILLLATTINAIGSVFPKMSEPIAITSGDKEHFFASYYGINSWSADQRYVTVLQTPIKYELPTEK